MTDAPDPEAHLTFTVIDMLTHNEDEGIIHPTWFIDPIVSVNGDQFRVKATIHPVGSAEETTLNFDYFPKQPGDEEE